MEKKKIKLLKNNKENNKQQYLISKLHNDHIYWLTMKIPRMQCNIQTKQQSTHNYVLTFRSSIKL